MYMKSIFVLAVSAFLAGTTYAQPRYSGITMEKLGRGVVAVRCGAENDSVCVSWRYKSSDPSDIAFNVYCNGKKLNAVPIKDATFFKCGASEGDGVYEVRIADSAGEHREDGASFKMQSNSGNGYISIPLDVPEPGVSPDGASYTYSANDASVGDVDGDGEYEIILKWDPSNSHDNSHDGYTGNVLFDCYRLDGRKLWRIDLGPNIRAGAHYTQFMVYDLDGDGRSEIVMKTADGTRDGAGKVIGDADADYRISGQTEGRGRKGGRKMTGRILEGPEYLTVFNGESGKAMCTVDYVPPRGRIEAWGDGYGNRCDRFLACVAYLDGKRPSVVMCRGYYTRTVLAAWDWDGKDLKKKWVFDTDEEQWRRYAGQGNHNLRVGDVDGDGCDEITYGSMCVDNDGTGLYNTGMGHGDALHQMAFYPDSDRLQIWDVHENKRDGSDFRDAATGKVIFQLPSRMDVGRGMAADIDPDNYGLEMWSSASGGIRNVKGECIASDAKVSVNSAVWWDGDLLRELLDGGKVSKYNWKTHKSDVMADFGSEISFNNGTKSNPCLSGDIVGDWREEVVVRTRDSRELRVYTTTIPTDYRFHTFMEDIPYRISIATQNVAYNQPPEPGFYFGSDFPKGKTVRGCVIK